MPEHDFTWILRWKIRNAHDAVENRIYHMLRKVNRIFRISSGWKKIKSKGNSIHSLYDKNGGVSHSNTEKGIATEYY